MPKRYDYAILGGGVAGGQAVEAIRRVLPSAGIVLVTAEPRRPYNRPPLSKELLLGLQTPDQVFLEPPDYYTQHGIDLRTGTRVTQLRAAEQALNLADGTQVGYGKLLYAAGAQARHLDLPGSDLERVFTLRTLDDSMAIKQAMQESKAAVVIGGSFIGAEVASALAQGRVETTMVFPEPHVFGRILDPALGAQMDGWFVDHGVHLHQGHRPARLEGERRVAAVVTDDGQRIPCDMAVIGVGVQLNVDLARAAGLEIGADKGIVADRYLRTSAPSIYVAGDVASYEDVVFGMGHLRVEHWDTALHQGMVAGANMAGQQQPYDRLPYFFSMLFGMYLQVWGSMTGWDQVVQRGSFERGSFAHFYFRQGVLNAMLVVGRPRDEIQAIQQWIRARRHYDDVAPLLANEGVEITTELEQA